MLQNLMKKLKAKQDIKQLKAGLTQVPCCNCEKGIPGKTRWYRKVQIVLYKPSVQYATYPVCDECQELVLNTLPGLKLRYEKL